MFTRCLYHFFASVFVCGVALIFLSCGGGSSSSSTTTDSTATSSDLTLTGTVEVPSAASSSLSYLTVAGEGLSLSAVDDVPAADCTCRGYTFEGVALHDDAVPVATAADGTFSLPVAYDDLRPTSVSDTTAAFTNDVILEVTCNEGTDDEFAFKNYVAPTVYPTATADVAATTAVDTGTTNLDTDLSTTNLELEIFTSPPTWGSGDVTGLLIEGMEPDDAFFAYKDLLENGDPEASGLAKEIGLIRDAMKGTFAAGGFKDFGISGGASSMETFKRQYLKGELDSTVLSTMATKAATATGFDFVGEGFHTNFATYRESFNTLSTTIVSNFVGSEQADTFTNTQRETMMQMWLSAPDVTEFSTIYATDGMWDHTINLINEVGTVLSNDPTATIVPASYWGSTYSIYDKVKDGSELYLGANDYFTFANIGASSTFAEMDCHADPTACIDISKGVMETAFTKGSDYFWTESGGTAGLDFTKIEGTVDYWHETFNTYMPVSEGGTATSTPTYTFEQILNDNTFISQTFDEDFHNTTPTTYTYVPPTSGTTTATCVMCSSTYMDNAMYAPPSYETPTSGTTTSGTTTTTTYTAPTYYTPPSGGTTTSGTTTSGTTTTTTTTTTTPTSGTPTSGTPTSGTPTTYTAPH